MYFIDKRLGYSDIDRNGRLTLYSIMNIFQDITTYYGEEHGVGEDYLEKNNVGWIVYNWNIEIIELPNIKNNRKIRIATSVLKHKNPTLDRYYEIRDFNGRVCIRAYATWVMVSIQNMLPTRMIKRLEELSAADEIEAKKYSIPNHKIEKCIFKNTDAFNTSFEGRVLKSYIDLRGHMNNARYLEVIMELIDICDYSKLYVTYSCSLMSEESFKINSLDEKNSISIVFLAMRENKEVVACSIRLEK